MRIKLYTRHVHFENYIKPHGVLVDDFEKADLIICYDWPKKIDLQGKRGVNLHISYQNSWSEKSKQNESRLKVNG